MSNDLECIFVMCDIDFFKNINDKYGHIIGDECLIKIAALFNSLVKQPDLVARVGGDEFLFIFLTKDIEYVKEKINTIKKEVVSLGKNLNIDLSISIGLSQFKKGDDWNQKMVEADYDLYNNKKSNKG